MNSDNQKSVIALDRWIKNNNKISTIERKIKAKEKELKELKTIKEELLNKKEMLYKEIKIN